MELWYTQQFIDRMKTWVAPNFESGDQRKMLSPLALRLQGIAWTSGHSATLRALSDSPMLAVVDDERNVADRKLLGTLEGPQWTGMFRFTSDGSTLVGAATLPIAGNNYRLEFWNVVQLKLIKLAAGHKGWITGFVSLPEILAS